MTHKLLSIIVFSFFSIVSIAQTSLNEYQYAMVPSKFKFLGEENQYRLNTTLKLFLEQKGFKTFLDDEDIPQEIVNNNCNKVYVDLTENNTIFLTKLTVVVKDCKNKVLLTSEEGVSRDKDLKVAYNQALLIALKSIQNFAYTYQTKEKTEKAATTNTIVSDKVEDAAIPTYGEMQTIKNGFNFLNKKTNTALTLYKTSNTDTYIAKSGVKTGIVFQKGEDWYFEYYLNEERISEKIALKF